MEYLIVIGLFVTVILFSVMLGSKLDKQEKCRKQQIRYRHSK